jgi:hypothetical protein
MSKLIVNEIEKYDASQLTITTGTDVSMGGNLAITGNLAVDTNTLYVDAASNEVGIGTSSPANTLFVGIPNSTTGKGISVGTASGIEFGRFGVVNPTVDNTPFIGSISNNDFCIYTNNSEKVRIDSSGNVGIGVVPSYPLHIVGENGIVASMSNETSNTNKGARYMGGAYTGNLATFALIDGTNGNNDITIGGGTGRGEPATSIRFNIGSAGATGAGTEAMRIDSSGNVSIKAPTASGGGVLNLENTDTAVNGQDWGSLNFISNDSSSGASGIRASVVGTSTSFNGDGNLVFSTAPSSGSNTERMRITSGGYLKASNSGSYLDTSANVHEINQSNENLNTIITRSTATSPYGISMRFTSSPNNTTNNFFEAVDGTTTRCIIYSNGNVVNSNNSYGAISDAKLKENIVDASPKLDDLLQIKVRNFNYIGDDKKQLGVVAQELEEVFPSMIDESPDFEEQEVIDEEGNVTTERVNLGTTTKSVKYSVFVPMLIKAMQEQQEIIEGLRSDIELLKSQING